MMNKQRTRKIGRTKYLIFFPLAALLMIVSNIEMVARTTKEFTKEILKQNAEQVVSQPETAYALQQPEATETATLQGKKTAQKTQENSVPQEKKGDQKETIFEVVEDMPDFPGGQNALMEYLSKKVKYPVEAQANGIQGRVVVEFVVTKDGSLTDIKTVRSINQYLDKEAERVIAAMPKWKPGKQRGQNVNVKFTVPVSFRLLGPEPPKAEEIKQSDLSEVIVTGYGNDEKPETENALKVVEKMPAFPGGEAALFQYLARSIKYPTLAQKNKEQGSVRLQMVIGKDGLLSDIKVVKSVSPTLDAEAIRVISGMPRWKPGMDKGKPVSVQYTLPVTFRLQ